MKKNPVTMHEDHTIRHAIRLIYNLGIGSVIVTKDKKVVGIVSDEDILQCMFPTVKDYMEDYTRASDFDFMEDKLRGMLDNPVSSIMTKNVTTSKKTAPLMKAASIMLLNNFSHLPVVDRNSNLLGIITLGDIFKAIAGTEVPYDSEEEYHNWISYHYDLAMSKSNRYRVEVDSLSDFFNKNGIQKIANIATATGSHDVLFAKKGYEVDGFEISKRMHKVAQKKRLELSKAAQERVAFFHGDSYKDLLAEHEEKYDAVVLLGNVLSHMPNNYEQVLNSVYASLKKGGYVILEMTNYEKVLGINNRLRTFSISPSKLSNSKEYAFTEFYDPPRERGGNCTLSMSVMEHNGRRWRSTGVNSTPLAYLTDDRVRKLLKERGFTSIKSFGSKYAEPTLQWSKVDKYDDWITVVAKK